MAFLDTGELPWGMDLFNERKERQVSYGRAQGTCSCSAVTHTHRGCDGSLRWTKNEQMTYKSNR